MFQKFSKPITEFQLELESYNEIPDNPVLMRILARTLKNSHKHQVEQKYVDNSISGMNIVILYNK